MTVDPARAAGRVEHQGKTYYFCSKGCAEKFTANPDQYLSGAAHAAPMTLHLAHHPSTIDASAESRRRGVGPVVKLVELGFEAFDDDVEVSPESVLDSRQIGFGGGRQSHTRVSWHRLEPHTRVLLRRLEPQTRVSWRRLEPPNRVWSRLQDPTNRVLSRTRERPNRVSWRGDPDRSCPQNRAAFYHRRCTRRSVELTPEFRMNSARQ